MGGNFFQVEEFMALSVSGEGGSVTAETFKEFVWGGSSGFPQWTAFDGVEQLLTVQVEDERRETYVHYLKLESAVSVDAVATILRRGSRGGLVKTGGYNGDKVSERYRLRGLDSGVDTGDSESMELATQVVRALDGPPSMIFPQPVDAERIMEGLVDFLGTLEQSVTNTEELSYERTKPNGLVLFVGHELCPGMYGVVTTKCNPSFLSSRFSRNMYGAKAKIMQHLYAPDVEEFKSTILQGFLTTKSWVYSSEEEMYEKTMFAVSSSVRDQARQTFYIFGLSFGISPPEAGASRATPLTRGREMMPSRPLTSVELEHNVFVEICRRDLFPGMRIRRAYQVQDAHANYYALIQTYQAHTVESVQDSVLRYTTEDTLCYLRFKAYHMDDMTGDTWVRGFSSVLEAQDHFMGRLMRQGCEMRKPTFKAYLGAPPAATGALRFDIDVDEATDPTLRQRQV